MGLSISVGAFGDYRPDLAGLSQALRAEGVDWHEPPSVGAHTFSGGFPYRYLSQLRRVLVLADRGEPVRPAAALSDAEYQVDLAKIQDEVGMLASHLLCHADDAGYYVPVDFDDPLFLPVEANVAGAGVVGSSQRLLAELSGIAAILNDQPAEAGDPFESERLAWHQLHRAGQASIASGHAIVFH